MSNGADRIRAERYRQQQAEGYDAEHDRGHAADLAGAAAGYAMFEAVALEHSYTPEQAMRMGADIIPPTWPVSWPRSTWKPTGDPIRDLVKAGALIAAAIDALEADR